MEFAVLQQFDNYIDAHIVMGRLQDAGVQCWLKDENVSSIIVDPVLTNVLGGIKLMVNKEQFQQALQVLNEPPQNFQE